jgi:hypothetical protein
MIKKANESLAATRSYDYLADGKYKTTKAWATLTDRHKKQNKPFTHLEGILEGLPADPRPKPDLSSIQDNILIKFAPAAQSHFNKPWFSPDVSATTTCTNNYHRRDLQSTTTTPQKTTYITKHRKSKCLPTKKTHSIKSTRRKYGSQKQ